MAEQQAQPSLVGIPENPVPPGAACEWLSLEKGQILIRLASWAATGEEPKGTVLLATGRAEFIEKYFEVVGELRERGFAVVAFDWRGQGGSSRLLADPTKGHVGAFEHYVDDLEAVVAAAALKGLPRPFYLLAHSTGASVALIAAGHLSEQIERMVLTAPLLELADKRASSRWAKGVAGLAARSGLANSKARPGAARSPEEVPFSENIVTSDPRRYQRTLAVLAAEPRLGIGGPTVRWFSAANRAMKKLAEPGAGEEVKIPTLLVVCGSDKVVSPAAVEQFAKTLRTGGRVLIPGSRHEILMERTGFRTLFWAAFDAFVPGSGLRLPTDIPPPKGVPALVSGALLESEAPSDLQEQSSPRPDSEAGEAAAEAQTTPTPADEARTADPEPAKPETEAEPVAKAAEDLSPGLSGVAASQEPVAEAPASEPDTDQASEEVTAAEETTARADAPEVAKRSLFGFFRRGRTAKAVPEPKPEEPAVAPAEMPSDAAAVASTAEDAKPDTAATEPTAQEDEQISAEAALSAAVDLVNEAARSEPKAVDVPTDTPAAPSLEESAETSDAGTPADAEDAEKDREPSEGGVRLSRLFRQRRRNGDKAEDATSETPAEGTDEQAEAAEAAETVKATETAASSEDEPAKATVSKAEPAAEAAATTEPEAATETADADTTTETDTTAEAASDDADTSKPDETVSEAAPAASAPEAPEAEEAAATDAADKTNETQATSATITFQSADTKAEDAPIPAESETTDAETAQEEPAEPDDTSAAAPPAGDDGPSEPAPAKASALRSLASSPKPPPRPVKRGRGSRR